MSDKKTEDIDGDTSVVVVEVTPDSWSVTGKIKLSCILGAIAAVIGYMQL